MNKVTLKKAGLVTLITIGTIGMGTGYYQVGKFAIEKVETVANVVIADHQAEQVRMTQLSRAIQMNAVQANQLQKTMVNVKHETNALIQESHMLYTVTGERDSDGYHQTVNGAGEECWLTDIETDNMDLKRGDRVEMVLNKSGELVSLKKVTN